MTDHSAKQSDYDVSGARYMRWRSRGAAIVAFAYLFSLVDAPSGGRATAEEVRQIFRRGHIINSKAARGNGPARQIDHPIAGTRFDGTSTACHTLDQIARPRELQSLWVKSIRFTESDLAFLARTPRLEDLHLPGFWDAPYARITDVGLNNISKLPHLTSLTLGSNRITDRGLAHLVGLRNLRFLNLRSSNITDAGIARLGDLPLLRFLFLRVPQMTDLSIVQLSRLKDLYFLDLCGTSVSGLGFAVESCPPSLSILRGHFTDDGLKCISRSGASHKLGMLEIVGDRVTDEGLAPLVGMPCLMILSLYDTLVTPEGIAVFRRAKPLTKNVTVANHGQRPLLFAAERLPGVGRAPVSRHVRPQGACVLRARPRSD